MILKILHIIPSLRKGGAERLVLDIISGLQKVDGINVKLITFRNENDYANEYPHIIHEVIPSFVKGSIWRKWEVQTNHLKECIINYKPHIIHTHLFEAEFVTRSIVFPGAKWFTHCHDNMVQLQRFSWSTIFNKTLFTNFIERNYLFKQYRKNGGNYFIAISQDTLQFFKSHAQSFNVTLLHNAINVDRFKIRGSRGEKNKLQLINVGTFVPKKNQGFLVEVAYHLKEKGVNFKLHLIGDGPDKSNVEEMVKLQNLDSFVVFHGKVDGVEKLLGESDIYLHAATYEPFGLVFIEAMAAGLPVICLDGIGNRDVIVQGKNGFIIEKANPVIFAEKILELQIDVRLKDEMSRYAEEFIKKFSMENYIPELLKIYQGALKDSLPVQ